MPQKMRVCNVRNYNKYLKQRGKIFNIVKNVFLAYKDELLHKRPKKEKYSNDLIISMYQVAYILKLSLRQLTGFFEDYAKTHHISAEIPNYSTLSRRLKILNIKIIDKCNKEELNLAIDSTSLNLYCNSGAHNKEFGKERNYFRWEQTRKMHIALNIDSKFVKSILYTSGTTPDHQAVKPLINKISNKV